MPKTRGLTFAFGRREEKTSVSAGGALPFSLVRSLPKRGGAVGRACKYSSAERTDYDERKPREAKLQYLGQHRVPTSAIRPHLERHLTEIAPNLDNLSSERSYMIYGEEVEDFASRAGVEVEAFANYMTGRRTSVEFEIADRLLCAAGLSAMAWYSDPELREHYWPEGEPENLLTPIECEAPDCSQHFSLEGGFGSGGQHRRRYCSNACAERTARSRRGVQRTRALVCRHGHPRVTTPQYTDRHGNESCMKCRKVASDKANRRRSCARIHELIA